MAIELPKMAASESRRKAYKKLFPRKRRASWLARVMKKARRAR
jgi:hypothetical protein